MIPVSIKWYYDYDLMKPNRESDEDKTEVVNEPEGLSDAQDKAFQVETFVEQFNREFLGVDIDKEDKGKQ